MLTVMGGVLIFGCIYILTLGNGRTYVLDEWMFVARRHEFTWNALFMPHNGHLSVGLALVYLTVFRTIGLDHPEAFRYLVFFMHFLVASWTACVVGRRHNRVVAAAAGLFVLLPGAAATDIVWGFQVAFVICLLTFLVALDAVTRPESGSPTRAAVCLVISMMTSGVGVSAIAAVGLVSWMPAYRRRSWWVAFPAGSLFLVWSYFYSNTKPTWDVIALIKWVVKSASQSVAVLAHVSESRGAAILVVLCCFFVWASVRSRPSANVIGHVVFILSFWVLSGMSRMGLGTPHTSRYVYLAIPSMLLIASEMVSGDTTQRITRRVGIVSVVLVLLFVQAPGFRDRENVNRMMYGAEGWRGFLAAMEMLRDKVDPNTGLVKLGETTLVTTGEYFAAVDSVGDSPAYPWRRLSTAPLAIRMGADSFLNSEGILHIESVPGLECIPLGRQDDHVELQAGESVSVRATPGSGIIVRRFFVDNWSVVSWRPLETGQVRVTVPRDGSDLPWQVYFDRPLDSLSCPTP